MVYRLASAPAGPEQEVSLTHYEPIAPMQNMSHPPDRRESPSRSRSMLGSR
jgi:hypothetical protein